MATITPDILSAHNVTADEYAKILSILHREPNLTELGIFSVMWSEHCSYKSSRVHLKKLPTRGKQVLLGPGENAGIIDIGDGLGIAFKIESHNHPSFIEPFQGAATGVGGILRDIFTMGARPIAVLDSLRFGPLDDPQTGARNRRIVEGVVSGISHYGNCFGVPTVGGECVFPQADTAVWTGWSSRSPTAPPLITRTCVKLHQVSICICRPFTRRFSGLASTYSKGH